MKGKIQRIGILTSGGDAPGMNACIRAVVRTALANDVEIYGIKRGYKGLIENDMSPMSRASVSNIIQRGGTILRTARCLEFKTEEGQKLAVENLRKRGIQGLIVIGGDGSFAGAKVLSTKYNIPTIGIPGTIDNDLAYTDYTLGFDTAVNTVLNSINNLRDTMASHERISIVEVMGNNCSDLALYAGIASGAEIVIVPEMEFNIDKICAKIKQSRNAGKKSTIIIIAEGTCNAEQLAKDIENKVGYSARATEIGHIQRGGSPTMSDRMLASKFGYHAVQLFLNDSRGNRVIGTVKNEIVDFDIVEALSAPKKFDAELYHTLEVLSL